MTTTNVLLTGACGFIGSHFVEAILKTTGWRVVGLDKLDETSTLERIHDLDAYHASKRYQATKDRFRFVWHDLRAPINSEVARAIGNDIDIVLHLAASTHVDRSIKDPPGFVLDNVLGTCHLLEWARRAKPELIVNFSTDECYGSALDNEAFTEEARFNSGNPYSATKAGAIELCNAYVNTYKLPIITTNCMNVFGQRQHVEKAVPLFTRKILLGERIQIHADPTRTKPAKRSYIHARAVWNAIRFLLYESKTGERYNIIGDRELDGLQLAQMIAEILGKPLDYELVDFHSDRPGHDLVYRLNGDKMAALGFRQPVTFEESMTSTVKWFAENPRWLGLTGREAA